MNERNFVYRDIGYFVKRLGVSERQLYRATKVLQELGLIRKKKDRGGKEWWQVNIAYASKIPTDDRAKQLGFKFEGDEIAA